MVNKSVSMTTRQVRPLPEPQAHIVTGGNDNSEIDDIVYDVAGDLEAERAETFRNSVELLSSFIDARGNICDLLDSDTVAAIGYAAVREWNDDLGSISKWRDLAEKGLCLATQDFDDEDEKNFPWDGASNIHYPILTTAAQQWAARAYPELIKGDKVVGVKAFTHPAMRPSPGEIAANSPQPQNQFDAQASQQAMLQDQQQEGVANLQSIALQTRAQRVAHYMNDVIFYQMDNWEKDTDLLLNQLPITGCGFKKVYMSDNGLQSEYVSPLNITVHASTKSMKDCPRITHDFILYPYQITQHMFSGRYNEIDLPITHDDQIREERQFIEQYRYEDLDNDGLPEPYIVTVDVDTNQVLRIEPAFGADDISVDLEAMRITRIDRWQPFPDFKFLPDPRGAFYAVGFARLLDSITDSIDTSINQLMDAGAAEIAGGGFITGSVRLQGSGQGGNLWNRPGEYQTVSTSGSNLRESIYERTVPHPSGTTFQLLSLLLDSAKDVASVKDVITGDGNMQAPVGTTLALQNQALQVFSSIYKRVYQGFREEFRLMFNCLKKFGGDKQRKDYFELTGGTFDEDFGGDGNDIQPIADPTVVTKMQKIARAQTVMQIAESPLGQAAGMTQPQQAQALIMDILDALDIDRPERFVGNIAPNPAAIQEQQAKTAETMATAKLKLAQATQKTAEANKNNAQATRDIGLATVNAHQIARNADELTAGANLHQPADSSAFKANPTAGIA